MKSENRRFYMKSWNSIESLQNDRKAFQMFLDHRTRCLKETWRKNVVIWSVRVIPPVTRLTVYRAVVIALIVLDIDMLVNHDFFRRYIRKLLRTCVRSWKGQLMENIYRVRLFQKIVDFSMKFQNFIESLRSNKKAFEIDSEYQNRYSEV